MAINNKIARAKMAECHADKVLHAKGMCRSCYEKHLRKTNPAYAERQRKNCRGWCERNAERKKRVNKEWVAKRDREWRMARGLKKYGLTPDDYRDILEYQGGVCAICKRTPMPNKRLAVDHCHETGVVRGLLCTRCNYGVGWFEESEESFRNAADYIANQRLCNFDNGFNGAI